MNQVLTHLFSTEGFPPRWLCGSGWSDEPFWGWLHIGSDLAVWGAYTAIPLVLIYFLRRRPDIPYPRILWLFVAFIFACGTVHLVEAGLFWWPAYRFSALVKLVTAVVSWITVFALTPLLPMALSFRSPAQLEDVVRQRTEELHALTSQLHQEVERRTKIARELAESESRLRMALRAGRMKSWDWDLINGLMTTDGMEQDLLAVSASDRPIPAAQFLERVEPGDLPGLETAIREAMEQSQEFNHEFRVRLPEGNIRWIASRGEVEFDTEGKPVRMRGIHFDVTESRSAHSNLRESEAFLRSILDSSADCIEVLDREGRLLSMNRSGLTAMEVDDFSAIQGRTWQSCWPESAVGESEQALQTALQGGIGRFQGVCPTAKGNLKCWDVILTLIGNRGEDEERLLCIARDITELRDITRARQESDDRFRTLADNIAQFAWMTDETGSIFWYNKRWFDYTGTTLDEMKGWGWKAVQHPDHVDRVVSKFSRCLQTGTDWEDTFPLRGKDGSYRWFLSRAMPIRDPRGNVLHWFGTNTDITERLAADQTLAQAHAQLKSIVDAAADAIVTVDDRGRILSANSAAEAIFGSNPKLLIGRKITELITWSDRTAGEGANSSKEILLGKGCEGVAHRHDGARIPVEVSFSMTTLGNRRFFAGIIRDMTDRKRTEEALRIRLRAIESATNGILITDALSADNQIVYVNPAFEQLTGYSASDAIGRNCRFLQGKDTDSSHVAAIRTAIQRQEECHVTILNYRKDGSRFWNDLHISPVIDDQGRVTHFAGIQSDITGRIRYEQRLREAQEIADSANRAKSEFLANMSHDIRTPLTAILGCADSLYEQLEDPDPKDVARMIRNQGQMLMGILNDVLDLSKIEAGKLAISIESCDLVRILGDIYSLMHAQAVEKGIEFRTTYLSPVPSQIRTDPLRLRQILLNIVSNAIKFTESGSVEVQVSCRQVNRETFLEIAVEDTGIGIPANRIESIFEAFSQEKNSLTPRAHGTGLGLTICQKLADMLEGTISVSSQVGKGSRFLLKLPLGEVEPALMKDLEELSRSAALRDSHMVLEVFIPCRVLIAEDTRGIQFMMARMLKDVVTSLEIAENGQLAIAAVERAAQAGTPFDIILMDMQMPVMSGFEATRKLRQRGYTLPVIALTAGAMAGDREQCLAAGCTDYLPKPIDRVELLVKLDLYCNA